MTDKVCGIILPGMALPELSVSNEQTHKPTTWSEAQITHTDGSSHLLGRLSFLDCPAVAAFCSYYIKPSRGGKFTISPLTMEASAPTYQTNHLRERFNNNCTDPSDLTTILEVLNDQLFGRDRFLISWLHPLFVAEAGHLFTHSIERGSQRNRDRIQFYYKDSQGYPLRSSVYSFSQGDTVENLIANFVIPQQWSLDMVGIHVQPYTPKELAEDMKEMPEPNSQLA